MESKPSKTNLEQTTQQIFKEKSEATKNKIIELKEKEEKLPI